MREIKFRAWDNENKIMVTEKNAQDIISEYKTDDVYYPTEWWPASEILAIFDYFQDVLDYPHMQVMQYTGLKDKNGVEIYEGDIISYDSYYIGDNLIPGAMGIVIFDNGSFQIDVTYAPELCYEDIFNCNIEVIGNLYENPELIE